MAKDLIWLSFDLGIQGDYEGMYAWLDSMSAKECGDGLAVFAYEHEGDLIEDLKRDLQGAMMIDKKTRIYVIRRVSEKVQGKFLFGNRKKDPWTGYAAVEEGEGEEDVS